jgi:hypothetical protein
VDLSRALRGRDQLTDLVRWARDDAAAREDHWLETKSLVDLSEKAWQAKIAKFVLGVSNRQRRIWEQAAEGCAYMLLGVDASQLHETPLPDSAIFEKGVNKYLGPEGPRWAAMPLEVDGTQVVVITVEPPEPGRRPYLARNTYDGVLEDGRVYTRRGSESIQASAAELDEILRDRDEHLKGAGPTWELRLEVEASSLVTVDLSEPVVQQWLDAERQDLVGTLLPQGNPLNAIFGKSFGDNRTREEFHQEVEAYLEDARSSLSAEVLWRLVDLGGSELQLVAYNEGDDILLELEVELVLPPGTDAAGRRDDIHNDDRLPERPRPYGSSSFIGIGLSRLRINPAVPSGLVVRSTADAVVVTLPKVEVRPRNRTGLPAVTILLPASEDRTELEIRWRASARDRRGVENGSVVVPIQGTIVFTQLLPEPEGDEDD